MKKLFTLLFCVATMSIAANASEITLVDRCINVLLGKEVPTKLMANNLDANHDGAITIDDVTTLIDIALAAQNVNRAPASDIDVDAIIDQAIKSETGEPNIHDVNKAVDHNLRNK
ncbi:MAG: hypothetical protein IJV05_00945 [Muribaculaceae bacterium]|nr:hypothetical protein [Muribaculaceae bacterium]